MERERAREKAIELQFVRTNRMVSPDNLELEEEMSYN